MISAAIIGIPPRKRIVRHDGGGEGAATVKVSTWGLFSSIQSIIRISHNHTNTCIFLLVIFSFTLACGKLFYLRI